MTRLIKNIAGEFPLSGEYAVIDNPEGVFPVSELVPLAPAVLSLNSLSAAVCDMDGTSTTTENLCIHSLESMIRSFSGLHSENDWPGLTEKDHPHIIGNSTTKHVEYLLRTYHGLFKQEEYLKSCGMTLVWYIRHGEASERRREVIENFIAALPGLQHLKKAMLDNTITETELESRIPEFPAEFSLNVSRWRTQEFTKSAVDVYYRRYHEILGAIAAKRSPEGLGPELQHNLIDPMPGLLLFLPMLKGLFGNYKDESRELAAKLFPDSLPSSEKWNSLISVFRTSPVKIALVTSSIRYEAVIVMNEVFRGLRKTVLELCSHQSLKDDLLSLFSDPESCYDAFITADDSHEIRLKPHRDLYSIALRNMNISRERMSQVIGLEDSESGLFSIRASGVGLAVALPFTETKGHNFEAASHVLPGGLPELMFERFFFLDNFHEKL